MNKVYSKPKVLLEAVRTLLLADNSNTGNEVREIEYYVKNNIYRTYIFDKLKFPQINISVNELGDLVSLPSSELLLKVIVWVKSDDSFPQDKLDNIVQRCIYLINKKPINLNNAVVGKDLRCRSIIHYSTIDNNERLDDEVFGKEIWFNVKCDDEIINE